MKLRHVTDWENFELMHDIVDRALAAAARQGGDGTAPAESPQSGHEVATPNPSPSHIPLMNKDGSRG